MEWMSEHYLQVLTVFILLAAMWSRNTAALCFAFLILAHDQLFGSFAETNGIVWIFSAGIFSSLSIVACILYRYGVDDKVAYYLAWASLFWLLVNIVTMITWVSYLPTEELNPIFAIMNVASIVAILSGGKNELNRTKLLYRHSMAFRLVREGRNRANRMEAGDRK